MVLSPTVLACVVFNSSYQSILPRTPSTGETHTHTNIFYQIRFLQKKGTCVCVCVIRSQFSLRSQTPPWPLRSCTPPPYTPAPGCPSSLLPIARCCACADAAASCEPRAATQTRLLWREGGETHALFYSSVNLTARGLVTARHTTDSKGASLQLQSCVLKSPDLFAVHIFLFQNKKLHLIGLKLYGDACWDVALIKMLILVSRISRRSLRPTDLGGISSHFVLWPCWLTALTDRPVLVRSCHFCHTRLFHSLRFCRRVEF